MININVVHAEKAIWKSKAHLEGVPARGAPRARGPAFIHSMDPEARTPDGAGAWAGWRRIWWLGAATVCGVMCARSAGAGRRRDALAGAAVLANVPGLNTLSRWTGTEDLLFKVRKNLFETLAFVARKPRT